MDSKRRTPLKWAAVFAALIFCILCTVCCGAKRGDTAESAASAQTQESTAAEPASVSEGNSAVDADGSSDVLSDASAPEEEAPQEEALQEEPPEEETVREDGTYSSKDEVALYIHLYGHLPSNYITKKEAEALGWKSGGNTLDEVAPGMSIGGDRFGNYEGLLPDQDGRRYQECDIDYSGGGRNKKRIVFSNDGLIFYTEDHYRSFEQLY